MDSNGDRSESKKLIQEILKCDSLLMWNFRGFEEVPEELLNFGQDVTGVDLQWNKLESVPEWMDRLKKLALLKLNGNHIRKIPDTFSRIRNLVILDIQSNNVSELPKDIGLLRRLKILNIGNNQISRLPEKFVDLSSLIHFNARGNELTKLPSRISNLKVLEELILDNNRLTSLPQDIVYLQNLKFLSLQRNELHYMPLNMFASKPLILIKHNKYLNYMAYDLGYSMARALAKIDAWNINVLNGCATEKFKADEMIYNRIVSVPAYDKSLVLPRNLQSVQLDGQINKVPTLYELTMRVIYKLCFRMHDGRDCIRPKLLKELPLRLQHGLEDGPVGTCQICETPIFKHGIFAVSPKSVFARAGMDELLSSFIFCSPTCYKAMKLSPNDNIMTPELTDCKLLQ